MSDRQSVHTISIRHVFVLENADLHRIVCEVRNEHRRDLAAGFPVMGDNGSSK